MTNITIPESVEEIEDNAFAHCYRLVEVYSKSVYVDLKDPELQNGDLTKYARYLCNADETYETRLTLENDCILYRDGSAKFLVDYVGTATHFILKKYKIEGVLTEREGADNRI